MTRQTFRAYDDLFVKAASVGIAMLFSSGDAGDDSGDTADGSAAIDFPSSDPLVTAVGGTSLGVGAANDYQFETGWATGTARPQEPTLPRRGTTGSSTARGGGVSSLSLPRPTSRASSRTRSPGGRRAVPDIAMDGDPQTGMLIGQTPDLLRRVGPLQ